MCHKCRILTGEAGAGPRKWYTADASLWLVYISCSVGITITEHFGWGTSDTKFRVAEVVEDVSTEPPTVDYVPNYATQSSIVTALIASPKV
jgi:hypothetical protein